MGAPPPINLPNPGRPPPQFQGSTGTCLAATALGLASVALLVIGCFTVHEIIPPSYALYGTLGLSALAIFSVSVINLRDHKALFLMLLFESAFFACGAACYANCFSLNTLGWIVVGLSIARFVGSSTGLVYTLFYGAFKGRL